MGDMTVDELKDKKLWFLWSAKPGRNGKVTKVPFAANGGATGTDDAHKGTWVSFDDAESARNQFQASGLGLKIPKGFFLLDIDHKDISDPFAQLMLSRFSSYAEVSPSGKGIHIIGQCDITKLPVHFDDRRKRLVLDSEYYQKRSDIGLELYIGDITNRYGTFTDKLPKSKKPCLSLRELEKQVNTDLDLFVNIVDGQMTVCELVDQYLKTKTGVRQSTKQGYVTVQRLFAKEAFGKKTIRSVKTSDVKLFLIKLQQEDGKSYSSIHTIQGVLRPVFQMAVDDNGMPLVAMHWQHRFNHMVGRYNDIYRVQIPNITPHVCRHTYCSNMAKSGMNPKTLQYLMGHSDISVTMNVYTHIGFDDAEEELKRMEEFRKAQAEVEQKKEKPMSQKMFKVV